MLLFLLCRTSATNYSVIILAILQRMLSLVHLMKFGASGGGRLENIFSFKITFSLWSTFPIWRISEKQENMSTLKYDIYIVNKLRSCIFLVCPFYFLVNWLKFSVPCSDVVGKFGDPCTILHFYQIPKEKNDSYWGTPLGRIAE